MSATSLLVTCGIITQFRCRFAPDSFLIRDKGLDSIGPNLAKSTWGQPSTLKPPTPAGAGAAVPVPAESVCLTHPSPTTADRRVGKEALRTGRSWWSPYQ